VQASGRPMRRSWSLLLLVASLTLFRLVAIERTIVRDWASSDQRTLTTDDQGLAVFATEERRVGSWQLQSTAAISAQFRAPSAKSVFWRTPFDGCDQPPSHRRRSPQKARAPPFA
jgi:C4-dicarboxylate-specific signal transduction histidine kinase